MSRAAALVVTLALAGPTVVHAAGKVVKLTGQAAGSTPFVASITATMDNPAALDYYRFTVQPKEGSRTRPISARYSSEYLRNEAF